MCEWIYIYFFGGISHQKHFRLLRGNFTIIVVYRYHLRLRFLAWPMSVPHRCRCATEPGGFRCIHAPDAGSRQLHTTHKQRPRERHTNTRRRLWKYTFYPNRHERTHKWRSIFFPSGTKYCRTLYTFPAWTEWRCYVWMVLVVWSALDAFKLPSAISQRAVRLVAVRCSDLAPFKPAIIRQYGRDSACQTRHHTHTQTHTQSVIVMVKVIAIRSVLLMLPCCVFGIVWIPLDSLSMHCLLLFVRCCLLCPWTTKQ